MRFAYADPPYPGMACLYKKHPDYAGEVDHKGLIDRLTADYPDGWALSTASTTLRFILPMCPETVRIMSWVKPFTPFRPGVGVAYAWEPVIVQGGRKRSRTDLTLFDWIKTSATLKWKVGIMGAKPEAFCYWLFEVLGMESTDDFDDLFPGTGGVTRAWEAWRSRMTFDPVERGVNGRLVSP
jgi:hypothetical protein